MGSLSGVSGDWDPNSGTGPSSATAGQGGQSGFDPWSAIIPGGVALANWFGGKDTNDANSAEAQANRDFQRDSQNRGAIYDENKTRWQATHGYQNAVEDMRKAGLNPGLMYAGKGGAESGSGGGGGSVSGAQAQLHNAMGQGLSSAMESRRLINELRSTDADIAVKSAQATTQMAQAQREASSARNIDKQSRLLDTQYGAEKSESDTRKSKARQDKDWQTWDKWGNFVSQQLNNVSSALNPIAGIVRAREQTRSNKANEQFRGLKGIRVR